MGVRMLPGFIASSEPLQGRGLGGASWQVAGDGCLATWGDAPVEGATMLLSPVVRRTEGTVGVDRVDARLAAAPADLVGMLPPFAAMRHDDRAVTMVADGMGFRQLFHSAPGTGGSALLSSSALVAARERPGGLDETAVANQSLLGWQLGQRTLFRNLHKLAPGAVAELAGGEVRLHAAVPPPRWTISLDDAVRQAADLMRRNLEALLDDHPEAVLQLTGGLDSRLLLSAVPPSRRRGLRAMTLGVPGSGDVVVASAISARYGLDHEVHGLAELDHLTPLEAWQLTRDAAIRLDAMSDPVAMAALGVAERSFPQGVRISGLGGECARGFYYVGRVADRGYDRADAARLARWRMFVNDAVEPGVLTAEFTDWAIAAAEDEVHAALQDGGQEWFRATDHLYLRHRMQRWAGATDTAVSSQRTVVNPMLDPGFLEIADRLDPGQKAEARFLSRVQMELDPELARMPLDGRPSPAQYAHPSPWWPVTQRIGTAKRVASKAAQRLRRGNRPPAGGEQLAAKVVEHWRASPRLLAGLADLEFLRQDVLADVLAGRRELRPSSVAFLANLVVATDPEGLS